MIVENSNKAEHVTILVNRLGRAVHCIQFAEGLNPAQWEALRYLCRANRKSRTPTALADYLGTTKGTASQTLKALESKGYVQRVPSPKDKRAVLLNLSEDGWAVLDRDPLKIIETAAQELGEDLGVAQGLLNRLVLGVQRGGAAIKSYGVCEGCVDFCRESDEADGVAPHQCGLTTEPLTVDDSQKICANHRV